MDRFGIGQVRLPEFHIDNFRLPVFGNSSGTSGNHEIGLHESLVDAWYFSGYSNENPPTEIVGVKGNALGLRNFSFSLNSGFGIYANNFTKFFGHPSNDNAVKFTSSGLEIIKELHSPFLNLSYSNGIELKSMTVRVTGLDSDLNDILFYEHVGSDGNKHKIKIPSNGIYTLPESLLTTGSDFLVGFYITDGFLLGEKIVGLTIEQIPEKDGYLCFDGVDDYAECDGLPLLEDYTLICRRGWIAKPETEVTALASKRTSEGTINGAFNLERMTSTSRWTVSYESLSNIVFSEEDVIYQTTLSYNGSAISRGTAKDTPILILGEEGLKYNFAECAIAYFALYSRTLTTQEIEKEKVKLEAEWNKRLIK
jgi:hypothetical protein